MNNIKLAWLAGIVEGEGCFSLASERRLIIQKLEMKGSKAKYTKIDNAYLESFKYLKTFKTESVETKRSTSYEDEVIVRTACINKDAELGRNDLTINLN